MYVSCDTRVNLRSEICEDSSVKVMIGMLDHAKDIDLVWDIPGGPF